MSRILAGTLVACMVGALVAAPAKAAPEARSELLLVLDASGSMWGQVEKEPKIQVARRVLDTVLAGLPPDVGVGLIAYGHRSKTDCDDIETVVEPGSRDRGLLKKRVEAIQPKGKTPITRSIERAVELLRSRETPSTVVLVSDGIETCDGDPCAAVRRAREAGLRFVLHVVGFDMGDSDVSRLECAAQAGGGLYLTADDAGELVAALEQALAITPETPAGRLSIRTTADGQPIDTLVSVTRSGETTPVVQTRTYTGSETNPRILPLEEGSYDVRVRAIRIEGSPEQALGSIEVRNGETAERVVDFGTGRLRVKVTRNGALSDATVQVLRPGTREVAASGRTYRNAESNPSEMRLPAGEYDVRIASVEIASRPAHRWERVRVAGAAPVELSHDFASGVLRIGATAGGVLVDATVTVSRAGAQGTVASGRTYATAATNPKSLEVPPGEYKVVVKPIKAGAAPASFEVKVAAGDTVERTASFQP